MLACLPTLFCPDSLSTVPWMIRESAPLDQSTRLKSRTSRPLYLVLEIIIFHLAVSPNIVSEQHTDRQKLTGRWNKMDFYSFDSTFSTTPMQNGLSLVLPCSINHFPLGFFSATLGLAPWPGVESWPFGRTVLRHGVRRLLFAARRFSPSRTVGSLRSLIVPVFFAVIPRGFFLPAIPNFCSTSAALKMVGDRVDRAVFRCVQEENVQCHFVLYLQVNIPKTRRTFCKGKKCKKHTLHKVTQYKRGKESEYSQGKIFLLSFHALLICYKVMVLVLNFVSEKVDV